ncbi:MAG: hypothetical protein LC794_04590 [Acidobacteria bacterium]|nr:hypothetical protein [Acidobacteriota bacterium]
MNIDRNNFVTDEALLNREHALRSSTFAKRNAFTSDNARRHFNEGFVRRHYMLQSSRLFLCQHCNPSRKEPLSPYEATDCAIHVNAYYLNLRGALDNLAWVLQYEWQLLAGVREDGGRSRLRCNLFDQRFLTALKSQYAALASMLDEHGSWARDFAELRDPAAHRVPIYVPPSVITSQEQMDKFRIIEAQADVAPSERGGRTLSEIYREAQAVADFMPVMVLSTPQGLVIRPISEQVRSDHDRYLTIARAIVDTL